MIATKTVTTVAGSGGNPGTVDGIGAAARFQSPVGVALDATGNLYVADGSNQLIRKIVLSTGQVTTLAGSTDPQGIRDGTGTQARFTSPTSITSDLAPTALTEAIALLTTDTETEAPNRSALTTG